MDFEISAINDTDEKNYRLVRKGLGEAAYYPDAVLGIYAEQHVILAPLLKTEQERHAGALIFGLCVKHLVTGANNRFRGQAGVMYRETRGAAESLGIAYRIVTDPATFKAYMSDRENDSEARKVFTNLTRSRQLFPNDAPPMVRKMGEHYGHASQKAHTNRMNFVRNVAYSPTQGTSEMGLSDFTAQNLIPKLSEELCWICLVHLDLLLASMQVFQHLRANFGPVIHLQNEIQMQIRPFMTRYGNVRFGLMARINPTDVDGR